MKRKHWTLSLVGLIALTFFVSVFLVLSPYAPNPVGDVCATRCSSMLSSDSFESSDHKLAVIVPFRDRFDQLLRFVPHIHSFLSRQSVAHKIFIVNQADELRFNRASLINIGFLLSRKDCDYLAMHDVDLLPLNSRLEYKFPGDRTPHHVSSPELHPKYHYKTFVGGILILTSNDFESLNGMSNRYWGWGLEDDEFYARMKEKNFNITRPVGIETGINDTFLHLHDRKSKRDYAKLFNQREVTRRRDRETGANNVEYELLAERQLLIDKAPCTVYDVRLKCYPDLTPWCDHRLAAAAKKSTKKSKA